MKIFSFSFLVLLLTSCSVSQIKHDYALSYREKIAAGNCERAQDAIPLEKDDTQFFRFYQGSIGYLAYVSSLPITVGLDMILLGRCNKYGCPDDRENKPVLEFLFPTTTYTYESSKDMRCPDTNYYIQKFLEIAECYEKRNTRASLETSMSQLTYIVDDFSNGPSCIRVRDAQVVSESKRRIEKKLNEIVSK